MRNAGPKGPSIIPSINNRKTHNMPQPKHLTLNTVGRLHNPDVDGLVHENDTNKSKHDHFAPGGTGRVAGFTWHSETPQHDGQW